MRAPARDSHGSSRPQPYRSSRPGSRQSACNQNLQKRSYDWRMLQRLFSPFGPASRPKPRHSRGFTMIELMVVVAIMGILIALAAPSFTPLIERWRVKQSVEGLQSTLFYARSEAIKRGGNVVIQKIPNSASCSTASGLSEWGCGWNVCAVPTAAGTCATPGAQILQRFDTSPKVEVMRTAGGARIELNRWGLVAGPFLGFSLMPAGKGISDPSSRGLCMSSAGRIRIILPVDMPCA